MPLASNVLIRYDGSVDITNNVLYSSAGFEQQMNAQPGSFEFEVKDPDLSLDFETGKEIELIVDGLVQFGGYILGATETYFFPVVDTSDLNKVTRKWKLRGVDYNTLFDRRVLRHADTALDPPGPGAYHQLPSFSHDTEDGALLREALGSSKYFDIEPAFDVVNGIDDVAPPFLVASGEEETDGDWPAQGSPMRETFESFSLLTGAVFYITPDKVFVNKALEDSEARWGFSDRPNKDVVTASPVTFQGATYGFREGEFTQDGARLVNDAFIWGGSEWSGTGGTVFAREENSASITLHHRWQHAETHFGEDGYGRQRGVNARADVIVNGGAIEELPGGAYNPGLRYPQWQITLKWFTKDVPLVSGSPDHLKAGDLVTFVLYAFGADEMNPLVITLPLRSVRMNFVALTVEGEAHVQFTGTFGLQLSDPYSLWRYLLNARRRVTRVIQVADGVNPADYGSFFSGGPDETPDGVITTFNLPNQYGYIGTTTEVYLTGKLQRRGVEYTESDPSAGEITFTDPPSGTDWIWIVCRLL